MLEAALVSGAQSPFLEPELSAFEAALSSAGVAGTELTAGLDLFERTVTAPALRIDLRLRRLGEEQLVRGGIGPAMVFHVGARARGTGHLLLGAPDELPRAIAELVSLGPRPFDPERPAIPMPAEPLDSFAGIGCGEEMLAAMQETFAGTYAAEDLASLYDGEALRWTLSVGPGMADEPPCVDVIDAGDRGLWLIDAGPEADTVWVRPMTSSGAWLLIVGHLNAAVATLTY